MQQGDLAPEPVLRLYLSAMNIALLDLRYRIRCGEAVSLREVEDIISAVENIPQMICRYGGWHVEENIQWHLDYFDQKYSDTPNCSADNAPARLSMAKAVQRAREFIEPSKDCRGIAT